MRSIEYQLLTFAAHLRIANHTPSVHCMIHGTMLLDCPSLALLSSHLTQAAILCFKSISGRCLVNTATFPSCVACSLTCPLEVVSLDDYLLQACLVVELTSLRLLCIEPDDLIQTGKMALLLFLDLGAQGLHLSFQYFHFLKVLVVHESTDEVGRAISDLRLAAIFDTGHRDYISLVDAKVDTVRD